MTPVGNNHLKNTTGGAFTSQTYGGVIAGVSTATDVITRAFALKDMNYHTDTLTTPKELSGNKTYNTQKTISSGTFGYNAAKNGTWVMSRVQSYLAGVANDFLVSMGDAYASKSFPYYNARDYVNTTSNIRKGLYSYTGYDSSGNKIKKRITWATDPSTTSGTDFGASSDVPTRLAPGTLYILQSFIDYDPSTSPNYYSYKPITGK